MSVCTARPDLDKIDQSTKNRRELLLDRKCARMLQCCIRFDKNVYALRLDSLLAITTHPAKTCCEDRARAGVAGPRTPRATPGSSSSYAGYAHKMAKKDSRT